MIKTVNLTKKFGDFTAVNNLNLQINKGELFSLLGVNGAGKTTTIKMLTTLTSPTFGEIYYNGENIKDSPIKIKSKMNLSPQETAIAPNLSVKENLTFIAGVYQIENSSSKVNELINLFNLEEHINKKAGTLSGGLKRRLSIAMALINNPEVLFLDEPTLGLDVIARRELWKIIESLKGKTTIILTTHYMEEAENLSTRVGIMANGELKHVGTPKEIIKSSGESNFENAFIKLATEN
ncbi:MAG: ABC transporter ATP-binding protein [Clostridia bacterium]|nr:ABC transporter ATP-binding protein [Clostridia bacterium]